MLHQREGLMADNGGAMSYQIAITERWQTKHIVSIRMHGTRIHLARFEDLLEAWATKQSLLQMAAQAVDIPADNVK